MKSQGELLTSEISPAVKPEPSSPGTQMAPVSPTPMTMIQIAVQNGASMDTIERLVALQERQLAREAEMGFNESMNRAQKSMTPVSADLTNPQTKSKYASYAALDKRVRPLYTSEGFSLSFDTEPSQLADHMRVVCYVSHAAGHTRKYGCDMPNDGKGAKGGDVMTKTHATGAAMSYGMRYLLKMIFNIAIGEDDTDGNSPVDDEMRDLIAIIQQSASIKEMQGAFGEAFKRASEKRSKDSLYLVTKARDARKAELVAMEAENASH